MPMTFSDRRGRKRAIFGLCLSFWAWGDGSCANNGTEPRDFGVSLSIDISMYASYLSCLLLHIVFLIVLTIVITLVILHR